MKERVRYAIIFSVLLAAEILIGLKGTGFIRSYIGDVLVIPAIYFLVRIFCPKDSIFSVYVLPLLTYVVGWMAEFVLAMDINCILGFKRDSFAGIFIGNVFDIRDILCYFAGLMMIGLYLVTEGEGRDRRKPWYPLAVFLHWTWGYLQTMAGLILFLVYRKCPHSYYKGVIRTAWTVNAGLSLGMFIFTAPYEYYLDDEKHKCEEWAVHEYGHTFQSLLLGPLSLIVIGIPSMCWGKIPALVKYRRDRRIPYTDLFCERWATDWGEKVTGERASHD